MQELKIDKTFREIIPPLSKDEKAILEKSIVFEGCREPIITWKGLVIDGHHRFDICTKNSIPYETIEKDFKTKTEALTWMIDNQLGRRNLNDAQKIEMVLTRENLQCNIALSTNKRKEIAKELNVGERNIAKVKKVLDKAPEEVKEQMRSGEISINKAEKATYPKSKKPMSMNPEPEPSILPEGMVECPKCHGTGKILKKAKLLGVDRYGRPLCEFCGNSIENGACIVCGKEPGDE